MRSKKYYLILVILISFGAFYFLSKREVPEPPPVIHTELVINDSDKQLFYYKDGNILALRTDLLEDREVTGVTISLPSGRQLSIQRNEMKYCIEDPTTASNVCLKNQFIWTGKIYIDNNYTGDAAIFVISDEYVLGTIRIFPDDVSYRIRSKGTASVNEVIIEERKLSDFPGEGDDTPPPKRLFRQ